MSGRHRIFGEWNGVDVSARHIGKDGYAFLKLACLHRVRSRQPAGKPIEFLGDDVERLRGIVERAERVELATAM